MLLHDGRGDKRAGTGPSHARTVWHNGFNAALQDSPREMKRIIRQPANISGTRSDLPAQNPDTGQDYRDHGIET